MECVYVFSVTGFPNIYVMTTLQMKNLKALQITITPARKSCLLCVLAYGDNATIIEVYF